MRVMDKINRKLHELLSKYGADRPAEISGGTLTYEGKKVGLLPWRRERRFGEMKNIVASPYFEGLSMYRSMCVENTSADRKRVLKRELDLFGYILDEKISEVFCVENDGAQNLIVRSTNGTVGVIELGFTVMNAGKETDKHEVIGVSGMVCDRAVDTQYRQQSVYVLGEREEAYTDNDFELYGLDERETALVRQAFDVLTGTDKTDYAKENAVLEALISCAEKSQTGNCNVIVGEEK